MFGEEVPYEEEQINECPDYRRANWSIGFGLQAIDGLEPSDYLLELAELHIAGMITFEEIEKKLAEYYQKATLRVGEGSAKYYKAGAYQANSMEGDFSSLRITEILSTDGFTLSPATLLSYHRIIFSGIAEFHYPVGKFRTVNITKEESVLNGDTVSYTIHQNIRDALAWDFEQEKNNDYLNLEKAEAAHRAMKFISTIWQIHPFRDGNTRTMAVFAIKYLRHLGFEVDNEPFKNHSKFFRDALVLANYHRKGQTDKYLMMFTENALLKGKRDLRIER